MKAVSIAQSKLIAETCAADAVIVLTIGGGGFNMTSYGKTKKKCKSMATVLDRIHELIKQRVIEIPEELQK